MLCRSVFEGSTELRVPVVEKLTSRNPVFYNPVMELSRDLSVAACRLLKPESYCDALAGSGARGIRIAKEAGVKEVCLNDLNRQACELMEENAKINGVNVSISNDNCNHYLSDRKFDFVDVDPFGPPVRYLDAAIRAFGKRGFLGVAATDTSALCGTYPRACRRKYDATSLRTDYYDEMGLRILLGFIARTAVRYEHGMRVLFSHSTRHYFRAFVELDRGRVFVQPTQDAIVYVQHCFKCLERTYVKLGALKEKCSCGGELSTAGPLWGGTFADAEFCGRLAGELEAGVFKTKKDAVSLVNMVGNEQAVLKPYFNLHKICELKGVPSPTMEAVFKGLSEAGFNAARTHFEPVGLRTDADVSVLAKLVV
ncbi:MAG: tRNA (guanine(10)-N(2))-dimethyltransferase [Candidatus Altiarchaeota archaeon]|nr:tRNA (guanine(10)-N(2))-dimethyltransferase [Candidatus Altiarchaeota archaeon]